MRHQSSKKSLQTCYLNSTHPHKHKSLHFVSPSVLQNVTLTKYFICLPAFLSLFGIRETQVTTPSRKTGQPGARPLSAQAVKAYGQFPLLSLWQCVQLCARWSGLHQPGCLSVYEEQSHFLSPRKCVCSMNQYNSRLPK